MDAMIAELEGTLSGFHGCLRDLGDEDGYLQPMAMLKVDNEGLVQQRDMALQQLRESNDKLAIYKGRRHVSFAVDIDKVTDLERKLVAEHKKVLRYRERAAVDNHTTQQILEAKCKLEGELAEKLEEFASKEQGMLYDIDEAEKKVEMYRLRQIRDSQYFHQSWKAKMTAKAELAQNSEEWRTKEAAMLAKIDESERNINDLKAVVEKQNQQMDRKDRYAQRLWDAKTVAVSKLKDISEEWKAKTLALAAKIEKLENASGEADTSLASYDVPRPLPPLPVHETSDPSPKLAEKSPWSWGAPDAAETSLYVKRTCFKFPVGAQRIYVGYEVGGSSYRYDNIEAESEGFLKDRMVEPDIPLVTENSQLDHAKSIVRPKSLGLTFAELKNKLKPESIV